MISGVAAGMVPLVPSELPTRREVSYIGRGDVGIGLRRVCEGRVRFETLLAFFLMLPNTLFTLRLFMDFMVTAPEVAPRRERARRRERASGGRRSTRDRVTTDRRAALRMAMGESQKEQEKR